MPGAGLRLKVQTQGRPYIQGFEFDPNQPADYGGEGDSAPDGRPDYSRMLPSTVPMDENESQGRDTYASGTQGPDSDASGLPGLPVPGRSGFGAGRGGPGPAAAAVAGSPAGAVAGSGAAGLINRLLTTPRPGGMAGAATMQPQAAVAQVFERGIAGVASTSEDTGVKIYKGRETFAEWEFVYDYRKDGEESTRPGGAQGVGGQQPAGFQGGRRNVSSGIGSRSRPTR